jgi:hypothetical protein
MTRDELFQRSDAVFSDRIGDRAEHPDRCDPHDQSHCPKQHGRHRVDQGRDFLALFATDQRQADAEEDSKEQHLEHVVARERIEGGGRDDVEEKTADAFTFEIFGSVGEVPERLGVQARGIDIHAVTGAERVGQEQSDHQRDRGHHLEIDQRFDADPTDFLQIAGARNSVHDNTEHDRRDDHGNQLQERVAQNLQADGKIGNGHSEYDSEHKGGQHLNKQRGVDRLSRNRCCGSNRGHRTLPVDPKGPEKQAANKMQIPRWNNRSRLRVRCKDRL